MRLAWHAWLLCAAALPAAAQDEAVRRALDDSRKVSSQLIAQVGGEMRKETEATGPMRAVIVCKYVAPEVASTVSRMNGVRVTRVSLKPRNPALGFPDEWEQRALLDFERRQARGEKIDALEHWEIVREPAGSYLRFIKAIPVAKVCLHCHGPAEQLTEGVRAQIAQEYPHDRAIGYTEGMVRGGVSVKRPWQP